MRVQFAIFMVLMATCSVSVAGEADVVSATAASDGAGLWKIDVTVRHADEGWDHYADLWQVVGDDGTVYGERELAHPHVDEQPFTRGLSGVAIPYGVHEVMIRVRDTVHGYGGAEFRLTLKP